MAHYLEYYVDEKDEGKEVLFLMQKKLALTTKKVRSVKHEEDGILLDGKRVTVRQRMKKGQILYVKLEDSKEKQNRIAGKKMPLCILYEDEDLLFVDKPAGLVSHPSKGHSADSLANGIQAYFDEKGEDSRIHLIGRLDKDTSGIVGIAKNSVTAERMIKQRKEGLLVKEYLALVKGNPPDKGELNIPVEEMRDAQDGNKLKMKEGCGENAKTARTIFRVLRRYEGFCLVSLQIETGRTHQIRVHMALSGWPLVGDSLYGGGPEQGMERAALHAARLTCRHPFRGNTLKIKTKLPEDFSLLLL